MSQMADKIYKLLVCVLLLILCRIGYAEPIKIKAGDSYSKIGKQVQFLKDYNHSLSFDDIKRGEYQDKFAYGTQEIPTLGLDDMTVWVKIDLFVKEGISTPYVIEIAYPTFDSLTFYIQNGDSLVDQGFLSDRVPFSDRMVDHKNFVIPLDFHRPQTTTIYLKIRNKGSIILPISILPTEQLFHEDLRTEILFGVFYGIMLVMLLYNLVLAFSARSMTYIYYVGIIAGNVLTLSALNGHAFMYLWYDMPWWGNHVVIFGIGLWILAGNLFATNFLDSKKYFPRYDRIFVVMQGVGLLIIILAFTVDYSISLKTANYSVVINCILLLFSGLYFWSKKVKVAGVFTMAWTVYLIGVLLYALRNLGLLPVNQLTSHALELGAATEVILLSISVGYKYRLMEIERNSAQRKTLNLMSESQLLVQKQNEELETKVAFRTVELEQIQDEILQQNNELNLKNDRLTEAQQIIEAQNQQLKTYTDDLESQVLERTKDLESTNTELAQNVQKLEQYAFMTAHNLRAPVARLLGLTHLLDIGADAEKSEWINILSKIKEEGDSLDAVIKDLNTILELRKEGENTQIEINLEEKLEQIKRILKNSIELSKADISCDTKAFDKLNSVSTYIESIFYNLISNAIKYRASDRDLAITIRTEIDGDKKILYFEDNGVGIDLEVHKDHIFGMYKRFHSHVEGKGLGLYLVKSQMDILGGKIEVQSKVNQGTIFTLVFPFS